MSDNITVSVPTYAELFPALSSGPKAPTDAIPVMSFAVKTSTTTEV